MRGEQRQSNPEASKKSFSDAKCEFAKLYIYIVITLRNILNKRKGREMMKKESCTD